MTPPVISFSSPAAPAPGEATPFASGVAGTVAPLSAVVPVVGGSPDPRESPATPTRRPPCPVCGERYLITTNGRIRVHPERVAGKRTGDDCLGSGLPAPVEPEPEPAPVPDPTPPGIHDWGYLIEVRSPNIPFRRIGYAVMDTFGWSVRLPGKRWERASSRREARVRLARLRIPQHN